MLSLKDWTGRFMVGEFSVPLDASRVASVWQTEGHPHPGLDFSVALRTIPRC